MERRYCLKYTDNKELSFSLPKEVVVREMKSCSVEITKNPKDICYAVARALDNPCGKSLEKVLEENGALILFVVDDHTRSTPVKNVLDVLVPRLASRGLKDSDMSIIIANGAHREMTSEEIKERLGEWGERFRVYQHNCYASESLDSYGDIDCIPLQLNKHLKEAQTILAIGSIVPHRFCGWAGGGKIIVPGLSGYDTIFQTHGRALLCEQIELGMYPNWFRTFMDEAARRARLSFLVNFVSGAEGYYGVVAGIPEDAFKEGMRIGMEYSCQEFDERFDVAIISSYPACQDLWQSGKGFYIGERLVRNGGTIILASPLIDGIGNHPEFASALRLSVKEIESLLEGTEVSDPLGVSVSCAIRKIMETKAITIVTDNSHVKKELNDVSGLFVCSSIDEALQLTKPSEMHRVALVQDLYVLPVECKAKVR